MNAKFLTFKQITKQINSYGKAFLKRTSKQMKFAATSFWKSFQYQLYCESFR